MFSLSSSIILCPVETGVSSFINWTVRFWTPDMSSLLTGFQLAFPELPGNLPGHVLPLNKNLNLDQNLHFGLSLPCILIYVIM
jgi:hypothetical protein